MWLKFELNLEVLWALIKKTVPPLLLGTISKWHELEHDLMAAKAEHTCRETVLSQDGHLTFKLKFILG